MNNRGYVMTEALIVSAVVVSALVLIYLQFSRINKAYNDSYFYNNINSIYALNQVGTYILDDYKDTLTTDLDDYLDITSCDYFNNTQYCNLIIEKANIKYLLLASNNRSKILTALNESNPYGINLKNFVRTLDDSDNNYDYILIGVYKNGTYASIPFNI